MGYYFGKGSRYGGGYGERWRERRQRPGEGFDPTRRREPEDRKVEYDLGDYPTPVGEDTGDTTGECSGGYRLADNPIVAGGGNIWEDEVITSEMGFFRNPDAAGHWLHKDGRWFHRKDIIDAINAGTLDTLAGQEGGMCAKGYQPKNINGESWCCPVAGAGTSTGTGEGLGWWEPPSEMQNYYLNLMGRGQEFLDMPLGFTPEMINKWFGRDFELIRGMEGPMREQAMTTLGREGMLGTGAVPERMGKIAWDVESGISDLSRNLFLESEMQKKKDILDYSGMAQSIFGTGMGYNQLIEAINASRRGERQAAMDALMQWLAMMSWR